jgi:UDP-glucose 4-epimerase
LVFSSSCCVYGDPEFLPITEDHPTGNVTNVYGRTKFFIEEMLKDLSTSDKKWNIVSLRYFNPVGAHPSGLIGEDPTKEFTNIMPYIAQVALGNKPHVTIFGTDYDTVDGTGVRDYIHVMDLASGHVAALKKLLSDHMFYRVYNLGLGNGTSVLALIDTFEKTTGIRIPRTIKPRRYGDVGTLVCDASKAYAELDWHPKSNLVTMCEDFWRWQTMNPNGYRDDRANIANGNGKAGETAKGPCGANGVSNHVETITIPTIKHSSTNGTNGVAH